MIREELKNFIPRKFKNIETHETVDFNEVVNGSQISVILGEPASGKTHQLKKFNKTKKKSTLLLIKLLSKYEQNDIKKYNLLDSIDEALAKNKDNDELILDLVKFIKKYKNKKKKFVITCRYLEWKENFEKDLKKIDKDLRVYEISPLDNEDINKLLQKSNITINDFWNFIEKDYLSSLLKNIIVLQKIIENFNNYKAKKINYIDIYQDIVEDNIKLKGANREDTKRRVKELLPTASSLATYMTLNRKDIIKEYSIDDSENFVDELYKINNDNIEEENFKKILNSGLSEKKGNDFIFFHKSIQEYLTAYFINLKNLDTNTIKKIFSHNLRFYEEFEEVIIYLTNMQPELFDDFVEFDPFIFRRHPLLSKEQQEKLLLSILDKLQNSESYAWDRVNFFYSSSLTRFDEIDIYSLIKGKNIENSQSNILLKYIMRVFIENYSEKLEDFIFEIFSTMLDDKERCRDYIGYGYHENQNLKGRIQFLLYTDNKNPSYSIKLFKFMKKNKLFEVEENSRIRFGKHTIETYLFFILAQEKDKYSEEILYLINYLGFYNFQDVIEFLDKEEFIDISTIEKWFNNLSKFELDTENVGNIKYLIEILLNNHKDINSILKNLIIFSKKYNNSSNNYSPWNKENKSSSFHMISDKFWNIYFSSEIQNFSEVSLFLYHYSIQIKDIAPIVKKYPIEDYFKKIFPFKDILKDNKKNFPLTKNQQTRLLSNLKVINNIYEDEILIEYIFNLLPLSYSDELEDFIFEILEHFVKEKERCRDYIEKSYSSKKNYNIRLFNFMKENNLFQLTKFELPYGEKYQNIERDLFHTLKCDIEYQKVLAPYVGENIFFDLLKDIEIEDIVKWFDYFCENRELLEDSFEYITADEKVMEDKTKKELFNHLYECRIGRIAYTLLTRNNFENIPLKKIITFFINTKIRINDSEREENGCLPINFGEIIIKYNNYFYDIIVRQPLFYTISKEFWAIYFSDNIENFKEIENFISLYHIFEKDVKLAIEQYPVEDYIEKYYDFAVQHNSIDILIGNKQYNQYIEKKQKVKNSLDSLEQKYLDNIQYKINIKNYSNENIFDIFYYALKQNDNNFKETDNQLQEDLQQNYKTFIYSIIKEYSILKKEYYDNCNSNNILIFNCLFNILSTKEAIDNALKSDENYKKLFWYILLGCISTENRELFKLIEDKFELFLEVAKELIEVILEKDNNHFSDKTMENRDLNRLRTFFNKIISFINFDEEQKIWSDFLEFANNINKKLTKKDLLELIKKKNKKSFFYFEELFEKDINIAFESFYKYIYDPIPRKKMKYSIEKPPHSLSNNMNYLFNMYLIDLKDKLSFQKGYSEYVTIRSNNCDNIGYDYAIDDDEKLNEQERLKRKLFEFYKDKNCSCNIVKIILFVKLLNLLIKKYNSPFRNINSDFFANLDKKYIEKILIDYYDFYKEEKPHMVDKYSINESKPIEIINNIWKYLQDDLDEENIKFLEKLRKNKNKYISNSANYALVRVYEEQEKDRSLGNEYYKDIFNQKKGEDVLQNNITNINVETVNGVVVNNGEFNQTINQKNSKTVFSYTKLLDDLIIVAKQILKEVNYIKFLENPINDKFISGLELLKYNVAGENRVNHGNERDIIIKDENQSERAIIEALKIDSIKKEYIAEHYTKLIGRYDVMGHSIGYMLIYVDNKNFEDRWEGYKEYLSEFNIFEDTQKSDVSNIKVGKSKTKDKEIYHIFINFYSTN